MCCVVFREQAKYHKKWYISYAWVLFKQVLLEESYWHLSVRVKSEKQPVGEKGEEVYCKELSYMTMGAG